MDGGIIIREEQCIDVWSQCIVFVAIFQSSGRLSSFLDEKSHTFPLLSGKRKIPLRELRNLSTDPLCFQKTELTNEKNAEKTKVRENVLTISDQEDFKDRAQLLQRYPES